MKPKGAERCDRGDMRAREKSRLHLKHFCGIAEATGRFEGVGEARENGGSGGWPFSASRRRSQSEGRRAACNRIYGVCRRFD